MTTPQPDPALIQLLDALVEVLAEAVLAELRAEDGEGRMLARRTTGPPECERRPDRRRSRKESS